MAQATTRPGRLLRARLEGLSREFRAASERTLPEPDDSRILYRAIQASNLDAVVGWVRVNASPDVGAELRSRIISAASDLRDWEAEARRIEGYVGLEDVDAPWAVRLHHAAMRAGWEDEAYDLREGHEHALAGLEDAWRHAWFVLDRMQRGPRKKPGPARRADSQPERAAKYLKAHAGKLRTLAEVANGANIPLGSAQNAVNVAMKPDRHGEHIEKRPDPDGGAYLYRWTG